MGGSMAQWSAYLLPDPAAPGSNPSVTDAEVNQRRWLEESGQLKMLIKPIKYCLVVSWHYKKVML